MMHEIQKDSRLTPDERYQLRDWKERRFPKPDSKLVHWFVLDVLDRNQFITFQDTKEIFYWNEESGLYEPAEIMVESEIQEFFDNWATKHMSSEILATIQRSTYVKRDKTDNVNLVPFQNGFYDLKEKKFFGFSPDRIFFTKHPVFYDPLAICPKINSFLFQIAEDDTEKVWVLNKIAAYTLYRDNPLQKAFILHGGGANGKSVYLNLIQRFLGTDNVVQMSIQELTEDKFAKSRLYQKNANIFADLEARSLKSTGIFKALTGGDYMTCDRKYMDPFEFRNYAKLIFSCNQPPRFNDDSTAVYRRLIPIAFTRQFAWADQNPNLLNEISTPEELSGWANELLDQMHEVLTNRQFGIKDEHEPEKIRDYYTRLADSARYFCSIHLELSAISFAKKDDIWNRYMRFCSTEKIPVLSEKSFWRSLLFYFEGNAREGRPRLDGERVRVIEGVLLNEKP